MRINIWIPDEDLELIDGARKEKSRSAFLVECALKIIGGISVKKEGGFELCKHGARKGLCKKGC